MMEHPAAILMAAAQEAADASRRLASLAAEMGSADARLLRIAEAAAALIADVRRRHPGEELRCPYMWTLDEALSARPEALLGSVSAEDLALLIPACRRLAERSDGLPAVKGAWNRVAALLDRLAASAEPAQADAAPSRASGTPDTHTGLSGPEIGAEGQG